MQKQMYVSRITCSYDMLRVLTFCARRKSLPASYAHAYERVRNSLRPGYGSVKVSVQRA